MLFIPVYPQVHNFYTDIPCFIVLCYIVFQRYYFLFLQVEVCGNPELSDDQFCHSVISNSLQPHRLQHASIPYLSPTTGDFLSDQCKKIEGRNRMERLEISSGKLEIPREYFMQRWAQ